MMTKLTSPDSVTPICCSRDASLRSISPACTAFALGWGDAFTGDDPSTSAFSSCCSRACQSTVCCDVGPPSSPPERPLSFSFRSESSVTMSTLCLEGRTVRRLGGDFASEVPAARASGFELISCSSCAASACRRLNRARGVSFGNETASVLPGKHQNDSMALQPADSREEPNLLSTCLREGKPPVSISFEVPGTAAFRDSSSFSSSFRASATVESDTADVHSLGDGSAPARRVSRTHPEPNPGITVSVGSMTKTS